MTLIRIDYVPQSVGVNLPLNLILPRDYAQGGAPLAERRVLYLLHGLSDDASGWQRYSSIETIAREHGLVVVMPSAGRSFYTDMVNGQAYFSYLTEELPSFLAATMQISSAREKTLIAGNSMGGYGAFKAAFLRPDLYFAACSLSGVLAINALASPADKIEDQKLMREFDIIFGGLKDLPGSMHDPMVWLRRAAEGGAELPRLSAVCGLDDDLLPLNRLFNQAAMSLGVNVQYAEAPGRHDWFFWQEQIKRWLDEVL